MSRGLDTGMHRTNHRGEFGHDAALAVIGQAGRHWVPGDDYEGSFWCRPVVLTMMLS